MRAVGAGLRVYFGQFIKCQDCAEIRTIRKRFPEITFRQFGRGFVREKPQKADISAARDGLKQATSAMLSGKFDLIVADEILPAVTAGLISEKQLLAFMHRKPTNAELILTGRGASKQVIKKADLVSEMKCIKHYYDKNVCARTGIEK